MATFAKNIAFRRQKRYAFNNRRSMKAKQIFVIAGTITFLVSCSPHAGTDTYRYLREVGLIRHKVDIDDQKRIPSFIRGLDYHALQTESSRLVIYARSIKNLRKEGVDSDAVQFADSFRSVLDSLERLCAHTAELLAATESVQRDNSQSVSAEPAPSKSLSLANAKGDTIAVEESLLATIGLLGNQSNMNVNIFLQQIDAVRIDRSNFIQARSAFRKNAARLKQDLANRFPDYDWNLPEILPH
jgi:hypothetical protein